MVGVQPALEAVHGVIVVPGSVYPAAHDRISCVPADCGGENPIQLTPFNELRVQPVLVRVKTPRPKPGDCVLSILQPPPSVPTGGWPVPPILWQVYGPDPMRKLFATGSKVGLSARTPPTVAMLGEPNCPTQVSSATLTILEPARFLPVKPLFQVLALQADQPWPGMMVTPGNVVMPPMNSSVKGPLVLRLRSRVNSSKTLM